MDENIFRKLNILGEAAKYDVSCVSSGVNRRGGKAGAMGSSLSCGICHSFTADGRCVSLLKVLLSNDCVFDCKYCINRRSESRERATFEPEELAELTMEFYRRNYIEGLFLSSAVVGSPDATMAEMCRVLYILRVEKSFFGYIHVKGIPGASPELIEMAGTLADRISINIEFPSEAGLKTFAPQKTGKRILGAMKYIQGRIDEDKSGRRGGIEGAGPLTRYGASGSGVGGALPALANIMPKTYGYKDIRPRKFAPGGQSTQMIIGATGDTDRDIVRLTENLYGKMSMKRVFYSAFVPVNDDPLLPTAPPPLLREHRLYQADWLLRFYGFEAEELFDEEHPNLDTAYDPKCVWALRHMENFPVEINSADKEELLRVPGIGVTSVLKILKARQARSLDFDDLAKMRISLKRARFFITCRGRHMGPLDADVDFIKANLSFDSRSETPGAEYVQLSMLPEEPQAASAGLLTGAGGILKP